MGRVDAAPAIIEQCLRDAAFDRASGARRRGQTDAGAFYRRGEVGDWRNHMSTDLADRLLNATEGLAGSLGYR